MWFKAGKELAKRYAWEIVMRAHDDFIKEESLVDLVIPPGVTCDVIGDVHGMLVFYRYKTVFTLTFVFLCIFWWTGQFYDMLNLFSLTGPPSEKHYLLMNGDLVDRGSWSVEVILVAFAYKCGCAHLLMFIVHVDLLHGRRAISQVYVHQSG